ncbi:hypothetical protein [Planctomycetes bacterium Pan216]|uniref:hypothetical protein n=1 Tax=Kolteria novifilia TaxID=2527975 RepID=UPI0011A17EA8
MKEARRELLGDGRWKLTATVEARKFHIHGWGEETEAELDTPISLAAFSGVGFAKEEVIWAEDRRLSPGRNIIELELDEKPTRFGIDPYLLLVDPNPHDNVRRVAN